MNLLLMQVDHMENALLYTNHCLYVGDSTTTCGIKWKLNNSVNLFTAYIPYDVSMTMYHNYFNNVLYVISIYCLQHNVAYCILGGDFNTYICRVSSMNTTSLHTFVLDECGMFCMKIENCINIDYTYYGPQSIYICN